MFWCGRPFEIVSRRVWFDWVHQGEVLYGVQRYPVDGLIPRVVQIEGTGVGLVVV